MFEVTVTKNGETRDLVIFDTELKAQEFIADRVSKNIFGEEGSYTLQYSDVSLIKAQEKINSDSLAYLKSTDWYILREMDSGLACPSDIKTERAAARARIQSI